MPVVNQARITGTHMELCWRYLLIFSSIVKTACMHRSMICDWLIC